MPLLKPINSTGSIKSLPRDYSKKRISFREYEAKEYLETRGRLLMLPILNLERSLKNNKYWHDNRGVCILSWPCCSCNYARSIRLEDLGFDIETRIRLRGKDI